MSVVLGSVVYGGDWTVKPYGDMDRRFLVALCQNLVDVIKMLPVYDPVVWRYPEPEGYKGGVGYTVVQPIAESYLALDYWPELDRLYLSIRSCKEYDPAKVSRWLYVWVGEILEVNLTRQGLGCHPLSLTFLEQLKWPTAMTVSSGSGS